MPRVTYQSGKSEIQTHEVRPQSHIPDRSGGLYFSHRRTVSNAVTGSLTGTVMFFLNTERLLIFFFFEERVSILCFENWQQFQDLKILV